MALNPIDKLKILALAKKLAVSRRVMLGDGLTDLRQAYPEVATQLTSLFAATDAEFAATVDRINTAINSVTVANADRVAYASADETAAKL